MQRVSCIFYARLWQSPWRVTGAVADNDVNWNKAWISQRYRKQSIAISGKWAPRSRKLGSRYRPDGDEAPQIRVTLSLPSALPMSCSSAK